VLSGLDLGVDSGERLVVAGPNGAGKTTLLRILSGGDSEFEGTVKFGAGVSVGYFSQDAAEAMQGSEQVLEFMEAQAPTALIPKVRDMLGAFLFRGDDVYKPVSVLSGGEKSRLALLRMLLRPMNLLILDEPTNHLDLHSKDILLDTLLKFEGTIIFVSHDRAFMEALSTKTLELSSGAGSPRARLFYGNYAYYLEKAASEESDTTAAEGGGDDTAEANPRNIVSDAAPGKSAAEYRAQNKQRQTIIRRLERQEAELLNAVAELESEKARLEGELSSPEVYSVGEKAKAVKLRLDECAAEIIEKSGEWEALVEELEAVRLTP
ncbi:MAG: ATP-binding cassette domain-containing protein, partial [Treponema sp.]|nr:ATP-binding cassette domain-containing protein [Treponema sp.]